MGKVRVFGNDMCPYCGAARMLLTKKRVPFDDLLINHDPDARAEMESLTERTSVPQVFIGDVHVGGFDELCALDERGELDKLLEEQTGFASEPTS
jgi:glutaredoxin 3